MAFPTSFDESNATISPPPGVSEDEIGSLSIWQGEVQKATIKASTTISCFKLTAEELAEVNRTGRIWLGVLGYSMPPVWIQGISPFKA